MSNRVTALILGGGQGKRLFPLTSYRSKPAVPIGGKYRLVDIPISNSINSGLRQIFVLTQFNSTSLHRHIHRTYPYEIFTQTSIELLAAEQTIANADWFQGTADAVRKNLSHIRFDRTDTFMILSGDHLYRMDYREILKYHKESNADVTVATIPVPKKMVNEFGIMKIKADGQITHFLEKPAVSEPIRSYIIPKAICNSFNIKSKHPMYLASMGIYVFKPSVLKNVLSGHETDFGREVIPKAIDKFKVCGYVFSDYWRDIGTIKSFYDANIWLTKENPMFDFLSPKGRIFTRPRFLPPTKIEATKFKNALISEGCILKGSLIQDSVIGLRSVVRKGSTVKRSILMGNDYYVDSDSSSKKIGIGKNCVIDNCILDKNVYVGDGSSITNSRRVVEEDGENYFIRDKIVIIPKGARISDGTKI